MEKALENLLEDMTKVINEYNGTISVDYVKKVFNGKAAMAVNKYTRQNNNDILDCLMLLDTVTREHNLLYSPYRQ